MTDEELMAVGAGLAGLVNGGVGAGLMLIRDKDDYSTRIASGCSAGLSIGAYRKRREWVGIVC